LEKVIRLREVYGNAVCGLRTGGQKIGVARIIIIATFAISRNKNAISELGLTIRTYMETIVYKYTILGCNK
jgi:hypothetical protein